MSRTEKGPHDVQSCEKHEISFAGNEPCDLCAMRAEIEALKHGFLQNPSLVYGLNLIIRRHDIDAEMKLDAERALSRLTTMRTGK